MSLFSSESQKEKVHSGIVKNFSVDMIKWEPETDLEASIIAHKFEYEDFPNGSYLIVGPSQMAVFTNNLSAGNSMQDVPGGESQFITFVGPCKIKLETGDSRFAPFRRITHTLTDGESQYHSTVFFINTTYMNELRWGTQDPVVVVDPQEEINVHVRAQGMFGVHIEKEDPERCVEQSQKFLTRVVGTRSNYTREELHDFMRAKILEYVPTLLGKAIIEENISVLKISAKLSEFSNNIHSQLIPCFDDFGLTLDNFSFHSISVPDRDLEAVNQAKIERKKIITEAEASAAATTIESQAIAAKRAREGYTFQDEKGFEVMGAAASNEGSGSNLMGAGIGLGMAAGVGGAMGMGIGNIAGNTIGRIVNPAQNAAQNSAQGGAATVKCAACGTENPAKAKFCLSCGEPIISKTLCPQCGAELVPGARFCMECGFKLGAPKCPACGEELQPGAKFCPFCGNKM